MLMSIRAVNSRLILPIKKSIETLTHMLRKKCICISLYMSKIYAYVIPNQIFVGSKIIFSTKMLLLLLSRFSRV